MKKSRWEVLTFGEDRLSSPPEKVETFADEDSARSAVWQRIRRVQGYLLVNRFREKWVQPPPAGDQEVWMLTGEGLPRYFVIRKAAE